MKRARRLTLAIASAACFAVLFATALASAPARADTGDHSDHAHHFVRITDGTLTPGVVHMKSGEAIAWGNYSAKTALILFDREVAKRIVCDAPGGFYLSETALESNPLRARQFASMCRMQPGEYTYRVQLHGATRGFIDTKSMKGMAGRIVVRE